MSKSRDSSDTLHSYPTITEPVDTTEVEFDFSFWDPSTGLLQGDINRSDEKTLADFLQNEYGMTTFRVHKPYLLIWTDNIVPDADNRPFLIAGLIAVWMDDEYITPPFATIGDSADGNGVQINEGLRNKLKNPKYVPTEEDFRYLKDNHFQSAIGIAFTDRTRDYSSTTSSR
jgi:hypothetical protein